MRRQAGSALLKEVVPRASTSFLAVPPGYHTDGADPGDSAALRDGRAPAPCAPVQGWAVEHLKEQQVPKVARGTARPISTMSKARAGVPGERKPRAVSDTAYYQFLQSDGERGADKQRSVRDATFNIERAWPWAQPGRGTVTPDGISLTPSYENTPPGYPSSESAHFSHAQPTAGAMQRKSRAPRKVRGAGWFSDLASKAANQFTDPNSTLRKQVIPNASKYIDQAAPHLDKFVPGASKYAKQAAHYATEADKHARSVGFGKPKRVVSRHTAARNAAVSKIMRQHGCSLGQASSMLKHMQARK